MRQLWLNFMLRREPRSSAPFQIHDSFDVSSKRCILHRFTFKILILCDVYIYIHIDIVTGTLGTILQTV